MTTVSSIAPAAAAAAAASPVDAATTSTQTMADGATKTTSTETLITEPGFFGRVARTMKNNPVATPVTLAAVTGVGTAMAVNYHNTGRALPSMFSPNDAADVVNAAFSFFR